MPDTHYVRSGEHQIAYQVTGEGPVDLVVVPPIISHLEVEWEAFPQYRRFYERLGRSFRIIRFDKQGIGMSDRIGERVPSVEERMDDVRAVMDAAASERAAVMGVSEGGGLAVLFCATYPARAVSLLLFGASARITAASSYEIGANLDVYEQSIGVFEENWGSGLFTGAIFAPSIAIDPEGMKAAGRLERLAATPSALGRAMRMNSNFDVRYALGLVSTPTLVMHRREEAAPGIAHGRYLAQHIAGARLVEYPGADHMPWFGGNTDQIADDIVGFVTGEQLEVEPEVDRMLATVLFTDIVDSTARAASLGDRRWNELLDRHDSDLEAEVKRFGGRLVKTTGDGALATFDGPGRAIRCAASFREAMRPLGIEVRAGLHAGEVERRGEDIGGIAVHIGARIAALARGGEVLVSSTVKDLVTGSGISFEDRGEQALKGVPDPWRVYGVIAA